MCDQTNPVAPTVLQYSILKFLHEEFMYIWVREFLHIIMIIESFINHEDNSWIMNLHESVKFQVLYMFVMGLQEEAYIEHANKIIIVIYVHVILL